MTFKQAYKRLEEEFRLRVDGTRFGGFGTASCIEQSHGTFRSYTVACPVRTSHWLSGDSGYRTSWETAYRS